ncbi:MAG TPA: hypothetical protein VIE42_14925 [Steroidobacteraceae bacterium]
MNTAPDPGVTPPLPDRLTLIAVSALAYVVGVALHEHFGHALACVALGSHPTEMGAYYINCDDARLSSLRIRLVELAGPFVSVLTGVVCLQLVRRLPRLSGAGFYFLWLLGALGLMDAAGYALFSGASGQGDLGTTSDGALYGATPEWLWRVGLFLVGAITYRWVMRIAVAAIEPRLSGSGEGRIRSARLTALTSYLTGGAVAVLIGALNPQGIVIVLLSSIASSFGGTIGLLFMMQWLQRKPDAQGIGIYFARSWIWIGIAVVVTVAYAAVFGPTLRP